MSTGTNVLRRVDALIRVGLRLARSARTGQILLARIAEAIELEWIPRPWGDELVGELEKARSAASEPIPWGRVERILRDAWDSPPDEELDDLEPDPVVVTPSAQVHRGAIDGIPVAVKVLRPGLAVSVRQDLVLLESLLAPLASAFPALDARAVIGEFRERVLEELDLEHEAEVQRRFYRALRGHAWLSVPRPITRLAHESVLVSDWVEALSLTAAPDADQAAARLLVFAVGGIREGIIHADPAPENMLVHPDGRLTLLDFGATRVIERERIEPSAAVVEAFCDRDEAALGDALETLGVLPASLAPPAPFPQPSRANSLTGRPALQSSSSTLCQRPIEPSRPCRRT